MLFILLSARESFAVSYFISGALTLVFTSCEADWSVTWHGILIHNASGEIKQKSFISRAACCSMYSMEKLNVKLMTTLSGRI